MKSKFDPQIHHRRSIRLQDYDYASEGAYFVTTVTQGRVCLLGEIVDGKMCLNRYGEIVQRWWNEIPIHFPNVEIGAFVIMPNHVHGVIFIIDQRTGEVFPPHNEPKPLHNQALSRDPGNDSFLGKCRCGLGGTQFWGQANSDRFRHVDEVQLSCRSLRVVLLGSWLELASGVCHAG